MKLRPTQIGAQEASQAYGEIVKLEVSPGAKADILKISDERQPAGSFPSFINILKDARPIETGTPKIGFPRYFGIFKKNLADKPGLFKKNHLSEPGMRKISAFKEFRPAKIGPACKPRSMKIGRTLESLSGKRGRAGVTCPPKTDPHVKLEWW